MDADLLGLLTSFDHFMCELSISISSHVSASKKLSANSVNSVRSSSAWHAWRHGCRWLVRTSPFGMLLASKGLEPQKNHGSGRWIRWISMDDGCSVEILRAVCHHCHVSREHICATDNISVILYNLVLLRLCLSEVTQNLHNR